MKPTTPVLLLTLMLAAAGCAGTAAPGAITGDAKLGGSDSADYLDRLSSRELVTEAVAVEGFLQVLGEDKPRTFAEGVAFLRGKGIVNAAWDFQADRDVTKGRVAYMTYQTCKIPGGLTLMFTGPSQRYCLKELQYRGLMAEGYTYTKVTGMEYVAILSRADEYLQTGEVSSVMRKEEAAE